MWKMKNEVIKPNKDKAFHILLLKLPIILFLKEQRNPKVQFYSYLSILTSDVRG